MERPRRLLFVANVAWFFASHRLPIALAARREGFDVQVAADPEGAEPIIASGLSLHPVPVVRASTGVYNDLGLLRKLIALYRRVEPDLVHHVTLKPVLFGSLAARWTHVPWVVNAVSGQGTLTLASGARARLRRAIVRPLLRLGSDRANVRVIFQNTDDRSEYEAAGIVAPGRGILIPGSGVDLDVFRPAPVPRGVPIVLLPARLIHDKGIAEFAESARLLRSRGVEARFVLVGPQDRHNATSVSDETLRRWIADGLVEWWGYRADMQQALSEASIVCLPSYREGMPKALLEAAAAGRPIVTTDTPGCRDCVLPGVTGMLVQARNVPALADALQALLSNEALRNAMGAAARQYAEQHFGLSRVIEQHLALYHSLLVR